MKPLISVIIPCYNISEYLPTCMQSLEKQTIGIENLELIFVDDASTDEGKTWKEIASFEQKYPQSVIAIQLEKNMCQGGARNIGLRYANADVIGFVDGDDWIEEDMYEKLWNAMQRYNCEIVSCQMTTSEENIMRNPTPVYCEKKEKSTLEGGDLFTKLEGGVYTKIYRKDLIITNDIWFPEHLKCEDNYWTPVLGLYVKSVCWIGDCLYHYRINSTSTMQQRNAKHHFDRMKIEKMKIEKYKELGIYDRFSQEFEISFLEVFYVNTLYMLWSRFDEPDYNVFCELTRTVRELFPAYKENPYLELEQNQIIKELLRLIDMNLTHDEFMEISKIMAGTQ